MKRKELRKLLSHFLKQNQALCAPGQKHLTALQAKLHYLKIIGELPSYGSKCFSTNLRVNVFCYYFLCNFNVINSVIIQLLIELWILKLSRKFYAILFNKNRVWIQLLNYIRQQNYSSIWDNSYVKKRLPDVVLWNKYLRSQDF